MPMRPRRDFEEGMEPEIYEIQVVDMFETSNVDVKLDPRGNRARVLEAYRVAHVQCPHLAIQSFVKALCDLHGFPYRPYLCQQFSIAYDLYLDLRRRTDECVMKALGRNSSWRLKHACPACTYKLKGEDLLIFNMLTTMDGNDLLKRVLRRQKVGMEDTETGEPVLGEDAGDGYFSSRARVEKWAKDRVAEQLPMDTAGADGDNPCADRWKNMINDVTSKMWGIFDETGIFLALYMIRSGELAKYPLAVVEELLDAFGMKLGAGYDVGCHFEATVANSSLADEAREKKLKCLVGSFHGHAHNRLCQLRFLATYMEGMGLEDLEGCERFFSRSNGLAKVVSEIATYAKHFDSFETYANLSKFLCNNYRQALSILKTEAPLQTWMRQEGIDSVERGAAKTNEETLEMEYVQKLVNLSASQARFQVATVEARRARGGEGTYTPGVSKEDRARRLAEEKMGKDLERVEELEEILNIAERAIKKRKYSLVLDALELLIVERIFELIKMNQSQTGYKMRKHIAKALQARSKAVKNAIERYNDAAAMLNPPMPRLSWEQVVEYAFLADFDILRDTRSEILRAREEIKRLNVEIRQVVTWIRDENRFLRKMEAILRDGEGKSEKEKEDDEHMAVQVRWYRERRGRFDAGHMQRFRELARTPGFTGSLTCGVAVEHEELQEQLRELRAELARDGADDEMEVDEEGGREENGPNDMNTGGRDEEDEVSTTLGRRLCQASSIRSLCLRLTEVCAPTNEE
ncbi:hypothetical protein B0H14DRAFT_3435392 [Mycena olivaceomarginata]|nr:hypothetical protein B0H14DRAFT_3435392 [Mycena olivaceomarginata]